MHTSIGVPKNINRMSVTLTNQSEVNYFIKLSMASSLEILTIIK